MMLRERWERRYSDDRRVVLDLNDDIWSYTVRAADGSVGQPVPLEPAGIERHEARRLVDQAIGVEAPLGWHQVGMACPACSALARREGVRDRDAVEVDCPQCGVYMVSGPLFAIIDGWSAERRAALAAYLQHSEDGDDRYVGVDSADWMVDEGRRRTREDRA